MKKLAKYIFITMALVAMSTTAYATSAEALPTASTVLVNGVDTAFEAYNIEDSNYFKLRDIAQVLSGTEAQFQVTWDQEIGAINIIAGQSYTSVGGELVAGDGVSKTYTATTSPIYLNGEMIELTAYNIADNNYFKLRDMGAALDFVVDWDAATSSVIISTGTELIEEVEEELVEESTEASPYVSIYPTVDIDATTSSEERVYRAILALSMGDNSPTSTTIYSKDLGEKTLDAFIADIMKDVQSEFAEFYLLGGIAINYSYDSGKTIYNVTFSLGDGSDIGRVDKAVGLAQEILDGLYGSGALTATMSDRERAQTLFIWCAENFKYDTTYSNIGRDAYGILTNRTGVCSGYAAAYNMLCQMVGIQCLGVTNQDADHTWSCLNLEGGWTYVDVTWGDPVGNVPDDYYDLWYFDVTEDALEDGADHHFEEGYNPQNSEKFNIEGIEYQ